MKIAKIIVCLITLSFVYVLNAGTYNGYTMTCTGITTVKPDSGKPQYRIKLTESSCNCTSALSGKQLTEISEIVTPGASFTSIGKSFVTPSEGYFQYDIVSWILAGDTGENVLAGPYTVLQITPDAVYVNDDGIKWDVKYPTDGTKVITVSAIAGAIDLTK